jgi:hypothetical protein
MELRGEIISSMTMKNILQVHHTSFPYKQYRRAPREWSPETYKGWMEFHKPPIPAQLMDGMAQDMKNMISEKTLAKQKMMIIDDHKLQEERIFTIAPRALQETTP